MKKPWFIWFSLFSFMLLFMWCNFTIFFRKKGKGLWGDLAGKFLLLWFGLVMIPCGLMSVLLYMLTQLLPSAALIWNLFIIIYIYAIGVYITNNLYSWYQKNLT